MDEIINIANSMDVHYIPTLPLKNSNYLGTTLTKTYYLETSYGEHISVSDIKNIMCIYKLNKINIQARLDEVAEENKYCHGIFTHKEKLLLAQFAEICAGYNFNKIPKFLDIFENTKMCIEKVVPYNDMFIEGHSQLININCTMETVDGNVPNYSICEAAKSESVKCSNLAANGYVIHIYS
jgi:hypothetical protein